MSGAEFDWEGNPEMPEGFFQVTVLGGNLSTPIGRDLLLSTDGDYFWEGLACLGSWPPSSPQQFPFTALREHMLKEKAKEEPEPDSQVNPQTCEHTKGMIHGPVEGPWQIFCVDCKADLDDRPQPAEMINLASLKEEPATEELPDWAKELGFKTPEQVERPWMWDVRHEFDPDQAWGALNWLADLLGAIGKQLGAVSKKATDADAFASEWVEWLEYAKEALPCDHRWWKNKRGAGITCSRCDATEDLLDG